MFLTEYEHQPSSLTGPNPQKNDFRLKVDPLIFKKKVSQSSEASLTNSEEKGPGKTGT